MTGRATLSLQFDNSITWPGSEQTEEREKEGERQANEQMDGGEDGMRMEEEERIEQKGQTGGLVLVWWLRGRVAAKQWDTNLF